VPVLGEPVLIVEGHSDVAAALTVGLAAVGRPNNVGGVEYLAPLLADFAKQGGEVIVLGENDRRQRPDGEWIHPGLEGAEKVTREVADTWRRSIGWTLPPKEVRR
jgi:hypothetical protein